VLVKRERRPDYTEIPSPENVSDAAGIRECEGYVASLDVLGFSDLMRRDDYFERLAKYRGAFREMIKPVTSGGGIELVVFSDSVVLTAERADREEVPAAFQRIAEATAGVLYILLASGFPVRGSLAYGSFARDTQGGSVFLAGRPLIEAYECEKQQKWIGVMLCGSVLEQHLRLTRTQIPPDTANADAVGKFEEWHPLATVVQAARIPFQAPGRPVQDLEGFAIVPALAGSRPPDMSGEATGVVLEQLRRLRLAAPTPELQGRYTATMKWLGEVREAWRSYTRPWMLHSPAARGKAKK
jgi:hypothetical protein